MAQPIIISSLTFVKPRDLSQQLQNTESSQRVAVIDVRDSDYLGGHIKGSIHAPVDQLDARMPELIRTLAGKDRVVFHCMLSQQRGPRSALAYARAKAAAESKKPREANASPETTANLTKIGGQEICVLEGGFGAWQKAFGEDKSLTEGYIKELWDAELI